MPSRLASIASRPTVIGFAQGAAQTAIQPVGDFLAPSVEVPTLTGKYKVYTERHRFLIPDTKRSIGGRATELGWTAADQNINLQPNALDFPVDEIEQMEESNLENALQEGAQMCAEVGGLAHEKEVVDQAVATLTAGKVAKKFSDNAVDPVDFLDAYILEVIKAARYGSLMGVRVLFGATAFRYFKNNEKVRARFPNVKLPNVTLGEAQGLLISGPECRMSMMVYDNAKEGKAADIQFLLDSKIIIFACRPQPTRRDPSFMKTFRLSGKWMVPGTYMRDDGRVEVAKFDWIEQVAVTNSSAAQLIEVT